MNRSACFILVCITIFFFSVQMSSATAQDVSDKDRARAEAFADQFLQAWDLFHDLRRISPKVFAPTFFAPSCEITTFIQKPFCTELSVEDRREYMLTLWNLLYGSIQHLLSEVRIGAYDEDAGDFDPEELLKMSFPPEIVELVKTNDHRISDMDDFREQFSKLKAAERLLFEHQLKHRHETLPTYKGNIEEIRKRMQEEFPVSSSKVRENDTSLGLPVNTTVYSVVRGPFMLILTASNSGELQVAAMMPVDN
jgi:hypothetical protein